jgi:hypothetical protein
MAGHPFDALSMSTTLLIPSSSNRSCALPTGGKHGVQSSRFVSGDGIGVSSFAGLRASGGTDLGGGHYWCGKRFGNPEFLRRVAPLAASWLRPSGIGAKSGVSNYNQLAGDYTNPILNHQAAEVVKEHSDLSLSGVGYPTPSNQCWPDGVPYVFWQYGMQMLQEPDKVTILYLQDHEFRQVRLNQPHPTDVIPSWYGDSVGHYEGNTLVIDTVGIKMGPFSMVDMYGTPYSRSLHVVERYQLLDYEAVRDALERDAKTNQRYPAGINPIDFDPSYRGKYLQLQFTVEDSGVFTTPWTAYITYGRPLGEWAENVCAENLHKYSTEKDPAVPTANKPDF